MSKWDKALSSQDYRGVAFTQESLAKGKYSPKKPPAGINSLLEDPMAIQYAMGYKDRKYSLSYDVLKRIPQQLAIVNAIFQTRINQIASFAVPMRMSKSLGYEVKHKDPSHNTTDAEREMIQSIETFIYQCGASSPNPHNERATKRDDFETFLRKIVRDSLMYDQCCWEIVPNRKGEPYEFVAVDASTIRFAEPDSGLGPNDNWYDRNPVWNERGNAHEGSPYRTNNYKDFYSRHRKDQKPAFVQIIDGQIHTTYTADELAFGVRNPRTDLAIQGYGYSELEQAITIVTSHLYAEEYNRRFFMQGSAPKGLLNFKGDEMTPDMLEGFKRHWRANLEGVENSWKTLITQSEQGVEWIDLQKTNQDMEYSQWVEYLLKILCALFLIDPAELNFDLAGGVSQTPLFESSSEWKLKASRDRGLKPMLRFIAKLINEHIVSKIDDRFTFDFVGLDELTENEKHELRVEQLNSYKTMNEIRREQDLPDIEYGDVPSSPAYIQARAALIQEKLQQEQGAAGGQPAPGGAPQGVGQPAPGGQDDKEEEEDSPAYADRFTKALPRILEVSFDDDEWISIVRDV